MDKDKNGNTLFGDKHRRVVNPQGFIKDDYYLSLIKKGITMLELTNAIINREIRLIRKESRIPESYASQLINRWFSRDAITWTEKEGKTLITLTNI